jgi:hypothetical protein
MYIYLHIYTKKQVKNSLIYWIITCYHGFDINKTCVPLRICDYTGAQYDIETLLPENFFFQNTRGKYPNLKRGHTEFWIMHGRHCLRTWCLDIVLSTRIITYSQCTSSFLLVENLNPIPISWSHHLINNNIVYCGEISCYISIVIYVFDWILDNAWEALPTYMMSRYRTEHPYNHIFSMEHMSC